MFTPTQRLLKIYQLLLLSLFFYFFLRLEFFFWNHAHYHDKTASDVLLSFLVGLRFDIAATMMMVAPLLLFTFIPWPRSAQSLWRWTVWAGFCLIEIPFMIMNMGDVEYINFVGRRFSYDALFIMNEVSGKMTNFLVSYWLLFLLNTLLILGLAASSYLILFRFPGRETWPRPAKKLWAGQAFLCFVSAVLFVIGIRGGLQSKPLSFVNANIFPAPVLNNLVLNSTFTFIKSMHEDEVKKATYFKDKEKMLRELNGSLPGPSLMEGHRFKTPQNVVIIILESFSAEYVGPHHGKTYTPFLDELAKKSLNFTNAFANARRSIEGVAAVMAGVPAMMNEPFISSHFMSNYFLGLGTLLDQAGYDTSFFHGANNGSMYFDSFMKSAGVDRYYGAHEFPDQSQHDGVWGIWDDAFLPFMAEHLNGFPQPFMSSVFTLTSHQPYKVPPRFAGVYPEGPIPILKCVAYTDDSLRKFFATAEKQPWFQNTLFVITADHTATHYLDEYNNDWGDYHIPLMFYHPRMQWPKVDTTQIVQQIDVLPSVLDFLNLPPKDKNFLGSSVFVPGDKVAVDFIDGRYLLFAKDYYLNWSLGTPEALMYSRNDTLEKNPLIQPAPRRAELETRLKAAIQYFGEGMWDNKLYYPTTGL